MPDDPKGTVKKEEGKPQEPVPSSNKPAEGTPDGGIKQRTSDEFDKVLKSNKELKAENESLKKTQAPKPSVLDELNPKPIATPQPPATPQVQPTGDVQPNAGQFQNLNQQQVNQIQDEISYVGKDGYKYVDTALLQKKLAEANKTATDAVKQAKMATQEFRKYEENSQIRSAYKEFPQLDPNGDSYDDNFYQAVKGELMTQAMKGQKDLVKAAQDVQKRHDSIKGVTAADKKAKKAKTEKEQINATGSAATSSKYKGADHESLVVGTRTGKPGALAERLRRSGY